MFCHLRSRQKPAMIEDAAKRLIFVARMKITVSNISKSMSRHSHAILLRHTSVETFTYSFIQNKQYIRLYGPYHPPTGQILTT